jgi:serine/threonine protein phosphatase PrpC
LHIPALRLGSGRITSFRSFLCTDGLTDLVPDSAIREVLQRALPAADACRALVELALEAGGEDNVTVALGCYHIADERG